MIRTGVLGCVMLGLVMGLAACVSAPTGSSAPSAAIADTSYTDADGSRAIQLSVRLDAPPAEVYRAVATAEGWRRWAAPVVFGEVKLNGEIEASYDPAAKAGDDANIRQHFLALVPERLVVFRTVHTPPGFPHPELYKRTVTVIQLASEGEATRLTFTHAGFGTEPGFDQLHGFFADGDRQTLEALRKLFAN